MGDNVDSLRLVWELGKGVMLVKHVQEYMELITGVSKSTTYSNLKSLEKFGTIDIKKFFNNNYVYLKKSALEYVTGHEKGGIKSIKVTSTKIKRSIFYNAYILTHYYMNDIRYISVLIRNINEDTTLFYRDKLGYNFLNQYRTRESSFLNQEVSRLKDIRLSQLANLKGERFDKEIQVGFFNINSMQARNIHILNVKQDKSNTNIEIGLFDIHDSLSSKKVAENIYETKAYLDMLFPSLMPRKLIFTIFVTDVDGENRILRSLKQQAQDRHLIGNANIGIVNFNLTRTAFGNMKFIN